MLNITLCDDNAIQRGYIKSLVLDWSNRSGVGIITSEFPSADALLFSYDELKPDILLLDEPTNYLDIRYQIEILKLVKKLNQEYGITIVMVLHDINQAITYSDRIIGLKDGQVLVEGAPEDVITEESIRELYGINLGVTSIDGRKFVLAV